MLTANALTDPYPIFDEVIESPLDPAEVAGAAIDCERCLPGALSMARTLVGLESVRPNLNRAAIVRVLADKITCRCTQP
ncbi:MAG: hypothetical protein WC498_01565 [Candidatus Saccharimonadales bacterium]